MDAPHILVVPIPAHSSFSLAATPDLSSTPSIDPARTSSETTIFTIYSMYEEEEEAWSFPPPPDHGLNLDTGLKYNQSLLRSSTRTIKDSAYYDSTYDPSHFTVQQTPMDTTTFANSYADNRRSNNDPDNYAVAHPSFQIQPPDPPSPRRLPTPPTGSRASSYRSSQLSLRSSPPEPAPSRQPSHLSLLHSPAASPIQSSSPYITPISNTSSAVVPLAGEDPDAFHVRRTYAELDIVGVKGDGYTEGIERTRIKIGASRESELLAMEALGDESEKKRDLTQKELQVLVSLDRYGFFTTPSHDRLIPLASEPLTRHLSPSGNPGIKSQSTVSPLQAPAPPPSADKEVVRVLKWGRMLEAQTRDPGKNIAVWGVRASKEPKLRERTYKGIPDCWRSAVWGLMMNRRTMTGKEELDRLADEYRQALNRPSTYDVQIDLDVPRTISGHVMFRTRYGQGQRSLFHVLHAISLKCTVCGYCQGMGPVAAALLSYFDPPRVYASMVRLHDAYSMHTIFSPGFPGLLEAIFVQEQIMKDMMPAVYDAFKKHAVTTTSYATKWYITLFANTVPFHTQLRLWDAFFLEGPDLFVIMAVAIVWVYKAQITSSSANFETILSLLSSFFVPEDDDVLLNWIANVMADHTIRTSMHQWRAEWNRLVATGEHVQALL